MKNNQIKTLLIANRGEIASRVIKTCKSLGIKTVAIYSEIDRYSLFVSDADIAICIGSNEPSKSYLDQDKIISVAKAQHVDAIHPGYGFLSENITFSEKCKKNKIIFIGPNSEAIKSMSSKSEAKNIMIANKVPVVPGYSGKDQSLLNLKKEAKKIGFPLLIKAVSGGGGKGMRIVSEMSDFESALKAAKRESLSSFSNDKIILEKYIENGRHIEFQIFGDNYGNVIHILERECTIQRRYQKVMEESPSPFLSKDLRKKMGETAVTAAKSINYNNAGTVEFIVDNDSGEFYFLEVNTRLQVEHPVTELITGLDLVKLQIDVAKGKKLNLKQSDVKSDGYAIELRLYAENPYNDFFPETGTIKKFSIPSVDGLRIDSAVCDNSIISAYYDPLIAKIIVKGSDREEAFSKMSYSLSNLVCLGIQTNQSFLKELIDKDEVRKGNYTTNFIEKNSDLIKITYSKSQKMKILIAGSLINWSDRNSSRKLLSNIPSGWRNSFYSFQKDSFFFDDKDYISSYRCLYNSFEFIFDDTALKVSLININDQEISIELDGCINKYSYLKNEDIILIHNQDIGNICLVTNSRFPDLDTEIKDGSYLSPMPSQIIKVLVKEGDKIKENDELIIISSMKMESTISAHSNGIVKDIFVKEGQNIESNFKLINIE